MQPDLAPGHGREKIEQTEDVRRRRRHLEAVVGSTEGEAPVLGGQRNGAWV